MANCVTAKHTGWGGGGVMVVVVARRCGNRGRQTGKRKKKRYGSGMQQREGENAWCWVTFLINAAQSSRCDVVTNKPRNETWKCPLVAVKPSIFCSLPKTQHLGVLPAAERGRLTDGVMWKEDFISHPQQCLQRGWIPTEWKEAC